MVFLSKPSKLTKLTINNNGFIIKTIKNNKNNNNNNGFLIKTIKKNSLLYKRSFKKILKSSLMKNKNKLQWFALEAGYGSDDTYGPIISTWKTEKQNPFCTEALPHTFNSPGLPVLCD